MQLDSASENRSLQFLAFLALLIEYKIFLKITVSYLIVGHTHEDVDQYFSVISRFLKRILRCVYSVFAFLFVLKNSIFKTSGCIPLSVENIAYCYDTKCLEGAADQNLACFDLDEKTGDKVHHFMLKANSDGKAIMQYKLKTYSDAIYPRRYNVGSSFTCEKYGDGQVIKCTASKDPISKKKFWSYNVIFKRLDGSVFENVYRVIADDAIIMLPHNDHKCYKSSL